MTEPKPEQANSFSDEARGWTIAHAQTQVDTDWNASFGPEAGDAPQFLVSDGYGHN